MQALYLIIAVLSLIIRFFFSNVLDLPMPSTLGDKPPLPTSLELQMAFRNGSSGSTSSLTLCSTPQCPFSYDTALREANDIEMAWLSIIFN